jgi:hypothetical protein
MKSFECSALPLFGSESEAEHVKRWTFLMLAHEMPFVVLSPRLSCSSVRPAKIAEMTIAVWHLRRRCSYIPRAHLAMTKENLKHEPLVSGDCDKIQLHWGWAGCDSFASSAAPVVNSVLPMLKFGFEPVHSSNL